MKHFVSCIEKYKINKVLLFLKPAGGGSFELSVGLFIIKLTSSLVLFYSIFPALVFEEMSQNLFAQNNITQKQKSFPHIRKLPSCTENNLCVCFQSLQANYKMLTEASKEFDKTHIRAGTPPERGFL